MSGMSTTNVPDTLAEIRDDFLELPEAERLQLLLEFSQELPEVSEEVASHPEMCERVAECQSPVYIYVDHARLRQHPRPGHFRTLGGRRALDPGRLPAVDRAHPRGLTAADRRNDRDADAREAPGHSEAVKPLALIHSVIAAVQPIWS